MRMSAIDISESSNKRKWGTVYQARETPDPDSAFFTNPVQELSMPRSGKFPEGGPRVGGAAGGDGFGRSLDDD